MDLEIIKIVLAVIVGVYEVLARVIPTIRNNSLTAIIIELLRKLSELLNRKKK